MDDSEDLGIYVDDTDCDSLELCLNGDQAQLQPDGEVRQNYKETPHSSNLVPKPQFTKKNSSPMAEHSKPGNGETTKTGNKDAINKECEVQKDDQHKNKDIKSQVQQDDDGDDDPHHQEKSEFKSNPPGVHIQVDIAYINHGKRSSAATADNQDAEPEVKDEDEDTDLRLYDSGLTYSLSDFYHPSGVRANVNTPASTVYGDSRNSYADFRRSNYRGGEEVYQRAVSLMSERERYNTLAMLRQDLHSSPPATSQTVYVNQEKPVPMPPLKAWRGYNGNVYFEPIQVKSVSVPINSNQRISADTLPTQTSARTTVTTAQKSRYSPSRSKSRTSDRSSVSSNSTRKGQRKMALLDKQAVMFDQGDNIQEDMIWIVGQESTGSLCYLAGGQLQKQRHERTKSAWNKEKICRGSVAHKLYAMKKRGFPIMSVVGDQFSHPNRPSPLLRAQTQYSASTQRLTMNSPVGLPPLEQFRASLRHMDSARSDHPNVMHIIPPLERMRLEDPANSQGKPFVKYSAEIRKSRLRQSVH